MAAPDRYGVMGYPISHSRSPVIHRLFALQSGQHMQYELLQVSPDKLEIAVRQFQRTGGKGLNVTSPHKNEVAKLADDLSERARIAGAVNTLVLTEDAVFGDNTDGVGLVRDLTDNLKRVLRGARILILGAGGATRGIVGPLLDQEPEMLCIANRTMAKANGIVSQFEQSGPVSAASFKDTPRDKDFDLIINATSAGLKGETPPYPDGVVTPDTLCYDLSYGLTATPFSRWAQAAGAAQSVMGWGMLVEQAAESFHLWRGVRPDTITVLKQIAVNAS